MSNTVCNIPIKMQRKCLDGDVTLGSKEKPLSIGYIGPYLFWVSFSHTCCFYLLTIKACSLSLSFQNIHKHPFWHIPEALFWACSKTAVCTSSCQNPINLELPRSWNSMMDLNIWMFPQKLTWHMGVSQECHEMTHTLKWWEQVMYQHEMHTHQFKLEVAIIKNHESNGMTWLKDNQTLTEKLLAVIEPNCMFVSHCALCVDCEKKVSLINWNAKEESSLFKRNWIDFHTWL